MVLVFSHDVLPQTYSFDLEAQNEIYCILKIEILFKLNSCYGGSKLGSNKLSLAQNKCVK